MPTYDYKCSACGHEFELFQPITAKAINKCPKCSRRKARRMIGIGAGIIFKGSGFYQTDYRSQSYKRDAEKDKPTTDKPKDTSKDTSKEKPKAKSESKPDSKKTD